MLNYAEPPTPCRARGMTLVEVLVSLVVISVGLLGVVALQAVSLRNSQTSYLRTQATALADDIIDRMRANRTVALAGGYNTTIGQTFTITATSTRADRDRNDWKQALLTELPATREAGKTADGSILVDGTVVIVSIRWGERDLRKADGSDDPYIEFVTSTEI